MSIFNASVRANLSLFDPAIPDERMVAALGDVELSDWFRSLPHGLDTVLPPGGGMSGGQAQLLAVARVLLKGPSLVILDEASSRLDPATEQRLEHALRRLFQGRTVIIIAHRLQTVQRVDAILILEQGRCVEWGQRVALAADSVFAGFWLEGTIIANVETLLRRNLLAHVYTRPGARAIPTSPGEALSRFRDDTRAVLRFLTYAPDIPSQIIVLGISLVVLANINVVFTLAVFAPLLVTIVTVNLATRHIRRYRQANQAATAAVTGALGEIFGAVQAIKAAGTKQHVMRFFSAVNERRRQASLRDLLLAQLLNSFSANAGNIAIGLLLMVAAQAFQGGARPLTVGDLALFVTYLTSLAGLIGFFGEIMTRYRQTEVSFARLLELMPGAPPEELVKHASIQMHRALPALPQRTAHATDALDTLIIDDLTYQYPDTGRGISGISLIMRRGEFTVVTGRVGSGKTTLLRALLGLLPRDSGEIRWNGRTVADPRTFIAPPRAAYVPQAPRLFSESLRNNIALGEDNSDEALQYAVYQAVMEQDVAGLSMGWTRWSAHRELQIIHEAVIIGIIQMVRASNTSILSRQKRHITLA